MLWGNFFHNISWGLVYKIGHHGECGAMEVFSHVRVLAKQGLLDHRLVEPLQLLVHPWEEEQGHLLHQDQGEDLSKSWHSNVQIVLTHLEHHEHAGILQKSLYVELTYQTIVQSVKPW